MENAELTTFRTSAELISSILNWVCPECGGRMGGVGNEFVCQGKCKINWRPVWERVFATVARRRPSRGRRKCKMSVALSQVRDIFKSSVPGNEGGLFTHGADNVDWTVEGPHPLAGDYHGKARFSFHAFEKLAKVLAQGIKFKTHR